MKYDGKVITSDFLVDILGFKKVNISNYCEKYSKDDVFVTFIETGDTILGHGYTTIRVFGPNELTYNKLFYLSKIYED